MNVIVANEQQNNLANLDVDIIKNMSGCYDATEIVEMFKSFFYNKMILDVTAMKQYKEIQTYKTLTEGLDPEKIVFLLPEGSSLCTPNFLGHLISMGIYNFTTNLNGVKYLIKKSNTLKDVEHIQKMASSEPKREEESEREENKTSITSVSTKLQEGTAIIGFKDVTEHAGATTLIYILKKELASTYGKDSVFAIEVGRSDFQLLNDKQMISAQEIEIKNAISKLENAKIILVDLNNCSDDSFCGDIIYLMEPTTLRLNKLVRRNQDIFQKLKNCKVVLNQSLLLNNDVSDFEGEAGIKVFYNLPPLDERKRNAIVHDFLSKLGLIRKVEENAGESNRIFGLFRR